MQGQKGLNKANKNNRNGIYLIPDADDFINLMEQLRKEYQRKNKGAKNNG